jgi:hypothetical protein
MSEAKVVISISGNEIKVEILSGEVVVEQKIEQSRFNFTSKPDVPYATPDRQYNHVGEKLASKNQYLYLINKGAWKDEMSAQEAFLLIKEFEEPKPPVVMKTEPLPWEKSDSPKRGRGRPRKS